MTLTLDLPKDVELQLQEQAKANGLNLSDFILATLSQAVQAVPSTPVDEDSDESLNLRGIVVISRDRKNLLSKEGKPFIKGPLTKRPPEIIFDSVRLIDDESLPLMEPTISLDPRREDDDEAE